MRVKELSIRQIEELYERYLKYDFPEDELKPLSRITDMCKKGIYFAAGLYDESDEIRGYAYFVHDSSEKTVLLDYLAIIKGNRDKGYGSQFFDNVRDFLKEYGVERLYLETENIDFAKDDDDRHTRTRRIAFYRKNGLIMTDVKSRLFGVDYNIMMLDVNEGKDKIAECDKETAKRQLKAIYDIMFNEEKFRDKVIIYE